MANHPLPPGTDWYFEFTVTLSGDTGKLEVGISGGFMPRFQLPGHYIQLWGYEGSTGQCWGQKAIVHSYPPFLTGDVVGCGFRFKDRRLYFTQNGEKQRECYTLFFSPRTCPGSLQYLRSRFL
ncbi:hypothetical protein TSTA_024140 [Talaromyces stipitatus ATCC 10500]|uniref:B30.2/SPRY domain-containing protein n=1 Tax=Talaromyces stipitatus (strain ATCC 10500 / CBS 375.48 / QM 6759 / NRRL 1006) TaxID=441959 RepID=B8M681_TALSN|nr:uncharacterized protein TSTA_024140 [Talaromyces stipitatus ATCC 10500]EED19081.1 hypothetical protein TSTA_024140 [Talaromyces stipitatus ATCC 10500]